MHCLCPSPSTFCTYRTPAPYLFLQSSATQLVKLVSAKIPEMDGDAQVQFTWSSIIFDCIKFRKQIKVLPLKIELGADFFRATGDFLPFARVRDRIFKGTVSMEPHTHHGTLVVYRKSFRSPAIGFMNVKAGCALKGARGGGWCPFIGISYGHDENVGSLTSNGIDFRFRLPIMPRLKAEVCGNCRVPLPAAQYEADSDGSFGQLRLGEGALAIHIAQLNPVIYV